MSLQHQRQWIDRSLVEIILWQIQGKGGKRDTLLRLGRQGSNRCVGMEIRQFLPHHMVSLNSVAAGVSLMCIYNRLNFAGILFSVAQNSNFQPQQTFAVLWVGNIYQVIGPDRLHEFKWKVLHSLFLWYLLDHVMHTPCLDCHYLLYHMRFDIDCLLSIAKKSLPSNDWF